MSAPLRRVLMTADAVGGVFSYALELGQMLSAQGVELVLATMGPLPNAEQRRRAEAIPGLTLRESSYRLEWMDDPWADVTAAGAWLLELSRRFAPDVVHLNGYAHAALPWGVPTLVTAHSCVLSWWRAVKSEPAPARYAEYRERVRAGLSLADCVVAPSRAMLRSLEQHYGALPRAQVLYNGCDLTLFAPAEKRASVVAAGRVWDEAKNLSALERVADSVAWPISIAGETQAPSAWAGTASGVSAQRLGLLSREQLAQLLASAAIYAAPARYEPFGLSILEAAAAGCALVLGDIASLRELWEGAALFVDPEDDSALITRLNELCASEPLRRELGERARARAARFSHARFASAYAQLYRSLASREGTSSAARAVPSTV